MKLNEDFHKFCDLNHFDEYIQFTTENVCLLIISLVENANFTCRPPGISKRTLHNY